MTLLQGKEDNVHEAALSCWRKDDVIANEITAKYIEISAKVRCLPIGLFQPVQALGSNLYT